MPPILEVTDLVKKYGDFAAVNGVSFSVEEGEVFGLLGPNGAGKTTVISMLTGVLPPTSGTARIGGYDIVRETNAAKRINGLVPQDLAHGCQRAEPAVFRLEPIADFPENPHPIRSRRKSGNLPRRPYFALLAPEVFRVGQPAAQGVEGTAGSAGNFFFLLHVMEEVCTGTAYLAGLSGAVFGLSENVGKVVRQRNSLFPGQFPVQLPEGFLQSFR